MNLNGVYELKAPRSQVWEALNNPAVIQKCTPGCKEMVPAGEDSYDIPMEVGVAAIKGRYKGKIKISDRIPGTAYKLAITGSGSTGFVNAQGTIHLEDAGEGSLVEYFGEAQIGGTVAGVGQRVIEGVAKFLVGQFLSVSRRPFCRLKPVTHRARVEGRHVPQDVALWGACRDPRLENKTGGVHRDLNSFTIQDGMAAGEPSTSEESGEWRADDCDPVQFCRGRVFPQPYARSGADNLRSGRQAETRGRQ